MEAIKIISLLFLLSASCTNKSTFKPESENTIRIKPLNHDWKYSLLMNTDSTYFIKWSNDSLSYITDREFQVLGSGKLQYYSSNDICMIFTQSCGTFCQDYVFLFYSGEEEKYQNIRAIDLENNLVALGTFDHFLTITNIFTKKSIYVEESNTCSAITSSNCITDCFFKNGSLFIEWDGVDDTTTMFREVLVNELVAK